MPNKISLKTCKPKKRAVIKLCNRKCAYCGIVVAETIDHVQPKDLGGGNERGNLLPACVTCNGLKSNITLEEFRENLIQNRKHWSYKCKKRIELRYADFNGVFYFEKLGVDPL